MKMHFDDRLEMIATMVEIFEDFLDKRGIAIENSEKEECDNASTIYGSDFSELYDRLEDTLFRFGLLEYTLDDLITEQGCTLFRYLRNTFPSAAEGMIANPAFLEAIFANLYERSSWATKHYVAPEEIGAAVEDVLSESVANIFPNRTKGAVK